MERGIERVWVGPSPTGLGVFAGRQFLPREAIGRIRGVRIDDPHYESNYIIELDERHGLEPSAPFRYINHSCRPNAALIHWRPKREDGSPGETEVWVEALAEIDPGEQVTIDYGWPAEGAVPCTCGSAECRGWIVAEEEIDRIGPLWGA